MKKFLVAILILSAMSSGCSNEERTSETQKFLNVSYDSTREFYVEYNKTKTSCAKFLPTSLRLKTEHAARQKFFKAARVMSCLLGKTRRCLSRKIFPTSTKLSFDKIVDKKGTRELAEEYLKYLYSPEGQELAAQNFYRPRDEEILKKYADVFKPLKLFTLDETFGSWVKAHNEHFADGATFDQIYYKK